MKRGNLGQWQSHWRVGEALKGLRGGGAEQLGVLEQKGEMKMVDFKVWGRGRRQFAVLELHTELMGSMR